VLVRAWGPADSSLPKNGKALTPTISARKPEKACSGRMFEAGVRRRYWVTDGSGLNFFSNEPGLPKPTTIESPCFIS
jgi:hypothetical protein